MKKNNLLQIPDYSTSLSLLLVSAHAENLKHQNEELLNIMGKMLLAALELKDQYTFDHSMRVAYYSKITGIELGISGEDLKVLEFSGLFHDIGKIATPDAVLNKPSRLSEEEFSVMKKHPEMSYQILKENPAFKQIATNAYHHHERFDGLGYPMGLKGEEIPLYSRIILIADTYDAMTSTRVYRKGLSPEIAFEELDQFMGTQFDPQCVKAFKQALKNDMNQASDSFHIDLLGKHFTKRAA